MTVTWSDIDVTWEVTVTSNDMAICSSLQSDRHFVKKWKLKNDVKIMWNCTKWLWPSARHFKEVTVTLSKVTVTLKWRADGQGHLEWRHFKWPSLAKFSKNFFLLFFCILGNFTLFWHHFSIFIFYTVTVTLKWRADGHVISSDRHF